MLGIPRYDELYVGLRDATIHRIHRHMVAIERTPPESQLREVARPDHGSIVATGQVHQDLRTLASLPVFKGHILASPRIVYILPVLLTRRLDVYLSYRHAQLLHQRVSV